MFPIIWQFLLNQYLKVVGLCAAAILVVLLITRLQDIAHFASLDASLSIVFLFVLYQIPYILPVAIPVSCLVSSILLVQRLSATHELTALRACGMGLKDLLSPILIAGAFLSIVNFYFVSEMATTSHLYTNLWKSELRSLNPLLLLKNKHLLSLKGAYFDTLGASQAGESASDVIMLFPNKSTQRISLILASKVEANRDKLMIQGQTLITALQGDEEEFDPILIENIERTQATTSDFAQLFQKKSWSVNNDYLKMPLLLSRIQEERQTLKVAKKNNVASGEIRRMQERIHCCYSEIVRRISSGMAVFTFTLMGASFGITISRHRSDRKVVWIIAIAAGYLATFFMAKGVAKNIVGSTALYIVPHFIIIAVSIWMLKRIAKGVDKR